MDTRTTSPGSPRSLGPLSALAKNIFNKESLRRRHPGLPCPSNTHQPRQRSLVATHPCAPHTRLLGHRGHRMGDMSPGVPARVHHAVSPPRATRPGGRNIHHARLACAANAPVLGLRIVYCDDCDGGVSCCKWLGTLVEGHFYAARTQVEELDCGGCGGRVGWCVDESRQAGGV